LYQLAKPWTQARASSIVAKPRVGQLGVYLQVRNNASENGLSFETRGRLNDAMTPSRSIVTFIVAPFIGLPLSAWSTSGPVRHFSAQTARLSTWAASSAVSRSWTSQPTILRLKMSTMR